MKQSINIDDDPKGGPDVDCIHTTVVHQIRQTCHGKVSGLIFSEAGLLYNVF